MAGHPPFLQPDRTSTKQVFLISTFLKRHNASIWGPDGEVYRINLPALRRLIKATSPYSELSLKTEAVLLDTGDLPDLKVTVEPLNGRSYLCLEWKF